MKTSSAIIKLVLRTNKVLSDGSHPIMLRCQFNGRKEISTGCSCTVKYWDSKKECVRKGYQNYATINELIHRLKSEAIDIRNKYEVEGKAYTPAMILQRKEVAPVGDIETLIKRYTAPLAPGTVKVWKSFLKSFKGYTDVKNIEEVTVDIIKGYGKYLERSGMKQSTIKMTLSKLAALCRYAAEEGIIKESPFKRWNYG